MGEQRESLHLAVDPIYPPEDTLEGMLQLKGQYHSRVLLNRLLLSAYPAPRKRAIHGPPAHTANWASLTLRCAHILF